MDNETGVTKVDWHDPQINKIYRELAEHYGTAVIPARVRHPKDKARVEGTVGKYPLGLLQPSANNSILL